MATLIIIIIIIILVFNPRDLYFLGVLKIIIITRKGSNCDALQLEASRRRASRSGLYIITMPLIHQSVKFQHNRPVCD